ncbi:hypothetical protein FB451DRAFT_1172961 [Mycena latifolia]|nr:hypothetical protein FB451DRAFT_1172961 [Mycena latifolia]
MSSSSLKITKLSKLKDDGSNWGTFKDLVMNALMAKGLRRHVFETELEEHENKLDDYLQKQVQVRQVIYETAQRMLQQLVSIYENKGEMVQIDTVTRLRTMRCLDHDDVASLPEKFRPLLTTIATASRLAGPPISSAMLIQEIYEMADKNTVHANIDDAEQTAMAASSGRGRARATREGKKDVKCENCDRTGHSKRDCWSKGGGKEGQAPGTVEQGKGGEKREGLRQR